jgi:hypothetical protein
MSRAALAFACALLAGTPGAEGFSIGVVELERNDAPGEDRTWGLVETPDGFDDGGLKHEKSTALAVVEAPADAADVAGATATFTARYAGIFTVDADATSGLLQAWQLSYRVVFEVDACAGCAWTARIEGWHEGALTFGNDTTARFSGASAVVESPWLGVDGIPHDVGLGFAASRNAGGETPFGGGFANVEIAGVGPALHQLDVRALFSLESRATSSQSFSLPSDELSARLGLAGSLSEVPTDDYPGVAPRAIDDDGIFTRVTVTLVSVPEPASLVLLGAGIASLRGAPRCRRARS